MAVTMAVLSVVKQVEPKVARMVSMSVVQMVLMLAALMVEPKVAMSVAS